MPAATATPTVPTAILAALLIEPVPSGFALGADVLEPKGVARALGAQLRCADERRFEASFFDGEVVPDSQP